MSTDDTNVAAADMIMCCASCGKAEINDIKLTPCDKCDLVHYCSDECQEQHRQQHEAICKLRAAELRDAILFKQPEESHLGDCPICYLPMPQENFKSLMRSCCLKTICNGCHYADAFRIDGKHNITCPFCRNGKDRLSKKSNYRKELMKWAEKNEPVALREIGKGCRNDGDLEGAFQNMKKAAGQGDAEAHFLLSDLFDKGLVSGVENEEEMANFHLAEAAIAGHPEARYCLGLVEMKNKQFDRAVKHWTIAATLGHDESIERLKKCYMDGHVSKDEFAAALRAHQAAANAMKSQKREEASWLFLRSYGEA